MSINHLINEEAIPKYDIYINDVNLDEEGKIKNAKVEVNNNDVVDFSSLPSFGNGGQLMTSDGDGTLSWTNPTGGSGVNYNGNVPTQIGKIAIYGAVNGELIKDSTLFDTDILNKNGDSMTGNLDMSQNNIIDVNDLYIDRLFTTAPSTEIQVENNLRMRGNDIVDVDTIDVNNDIITPDIKTDTITTNTLGKILFNNDIDLFNNDILSSGNIKTTSFSSTDGKTNDIDVNCNFDLQGTRNIKNVNILQTNEIAKTSGVAVIFDDNIEMGGIYDITNCNQLEVSSIASAVTPDINILNTLDLNTNVIENVGNLNVTSINSITPVGGLYSGISDGNVINQASGQSDLLPVSSVGSLNIPANGFQVGDAYHLVVAGTFPTEVKNDDITIEIKQNGTTLGVLTLELKNPDTTPSNFEVEADFVIRSTGVSGSLASNIDFTFNEDVDSKFEGTRSTTVTTIDTTTASSLSVLATVTGGSSIQSRLAYLRKQY